jgi:hypothetical protein
MLKAFCRVAPSVRFRVRAILPAVAFFRASRFISRTSLAVQERRFFPFLISISFNEADAFSRKFQEWKALFAQLVIYRCKWADAVPTVNGSVSAAVLPSSETR